MEKLLYLELIKISKKNLKKSKNVKNAWEAVYLCVEHGVIFLKLHNEYKYQKN